MGAVIFEQGAPGQKGSWWPAADDELKAFHWCCPRCALDVHAMLSRKVGADGVVETEVGCPACQWAGMITLEGYDATQHRPVPPDHPDRDRREMRHYCGTVIELDPETALHFAHDPRTARGHWCPKCKRHGWNHEWRWVKNNHVVGDGWCGRLRYEEITDPKYRALLEQHVRIPVHWGAH